MTDEATPLRPIDPLAHRALEALVRAQANLTRRLAADLERIGVSATGFTMLVLLTSAGGRLELRAMRRRLGASKATATEVLDTLETRGSIARYDASTGDTPTTLELRPSNAVAPVGDSHTVTAKDLMVQPNPPHLQ